MKNMCIMNYCYLNIGQIFVLRPSDVRSTCSELLLFVYIKMVENDTFEIISGKKDVN